MNSHKSVSKMNNQKGGEMFIYCLDLCCNISSHGGINFFDHITEAVKIHIFQCMGHYLICMIRMNRSGLCINDNRSVCTHRLSAKQHFCWKTSSAQLDSGIIRSGKIICNDQVSFFQPFHLTFINVTNLNILYNKFIEIERQKRVEYKTKEKKI